MQATSQPSIATPLSVVTPSKVNWPHVAWFLGLAFGLTWLADLVLYLNGGLASPITALLLQFQMLSTGLLCDASGGLFLQGKPDLLPVQPYGFTLVCIFLPLPHRFISDRLNCQL